MPFTPRDITETELAVLRQLWKRGPSTIRKLTDRLYPDGTHSQYATVQSLLDRLEQKDCVERTKKGRVNVFAAAVSRGDIIGRRLRQTADTLCDGSMAPLLSHLVTDLDLDEDEISALKKLVERLDEGRGSEGRG